MPQDGGNEQDPDDKGGGAGTKKRHPAKKVDALITHLRNTYGSTHAALSALANTNLDLEAEAEALRAKLPKDTDAVAPKAELDAYRALGTPDQVGRKLKDGETAAAEMARVKRAESYGEKATAAGLAPKALVKLAETAGFVPDEVREEERDGRKVKVLYVRDAADEKAKAVPLEQFAAERDFAEFLPALTAGDGKGGGQQPPKPNGPAWPHQAPNGGAPSAGATQQQQEQQKRAEIGSLF